MSATWWRTLAAVGTAAGLVLGVGFLPASAAEASPASPSARRAPAAAAWVVNASLISGRHSAQLAQVRASSGGARSAWAAPVALNGQRPVEVAADPAHPEATDEKLTWHDPTGGMTISGGYGTASVTATSASARAGIAAGSGSSFALASKTLSWEQQQQLTGAVADLNDAVVDPLNATLAMLSPRLSLLGLSVPRLQKMSAVAVINVGSAEAVSASASTAFSPGNSTARAAAAVSSVQLFDGFISLEGVRATASSEDTFGTKTVTSAATFKRVWIAGLAVEIDDRGIHVLGNNAVERKILQPILDDLLDSLASHGVKLRFGQASGRGNFREATAFELSVATSSGRLMLSVGHAQASAPPPPPIPAAAASSTSPTRTYTVPHTPAAASSDPPAPEYVPVEPAVPPMAAGPETFDTEPSAPSESLITATGPSSGAPQGIPSWLGVTLPRAAAKALANVFLILLLGGLALAMIPPMVLGATNRRPTGRPTVRLPLLHKEVIP